jgi:hypothetical protein
MRRPLLLLLALVAALIAACGGDEPPPSPPGSPANPLVAQTAEPGAPASAREPGPAVEREPRPASAAKPGYKALVDRQSRNPRKRFTPCNLVTAAQAGVILGAPVHAPVEAPQGPTCIYRTRKGDGFVTVAVQATPLNRLKRNMLVLRRVRISDRVAYCGTYGQSMLYVPLSKGRVLSIAAPCVVAQEFAARAMRQLSA